MRNLFCFIVVISFIFSPFAFSAKKDAKFQIKPIEFDYPWIKKSEMPKLMKAAKKRGKLRKLASNISDKMMSKELRKFRDAFIKISTPEQLQMKLHELDSNYDKHPLDLKYVTAQVILISIFRGIVYRLKPVAAKQKITHSYLLTTIRKLASNMRIFFPSKHVEAVFNYVTEPYLDNDRKLVSRFHEAADIQRYLGSFGIKQLLKAAKRLRNLSLAGKQIVWDNKIYHGTDTFVDDLERYSILTEADRHATLSAIHGGIAYIAGFCAYNQKNLFALIKEQGRLYGIDGYITKIKGVSSYDKVKVFYKRNWLGRGTKEYKPKYKYLFVLMGNGRDWMQYLLKHKVEAVRHMRLAWEELRDRPAEEYANLNPAKVNPWARNIDLNLKNMEAMLNGVAEIRNKITGHVVKVNLPKFYNDPPIDLKALLPTDWDLKNEFKTKHGAEYRNYHWKKATNWNLALYKKYLPNLKTADDLPKTIRTLNQAWAGWLVGLPLLKFYQ